MGKKGKKGKKADSKREPASGDVATNRRARHDYDITQVYEADDAVCYEMAVYALDEPIMAAHIHAGAPGEAGDAVDHQVLA